MKISHVSFLVQNEIRFRNHFFNLSLSIEWFLENLIFDTKIFSQGYV